MPIEATSALHLGVEAMHIASYNIHKAVCFDRDGRHAGTVLDDLERIEVLRAADVLAVQEAIVGPLRSGEAARDTVAELAAGAGIGAGDPHRAFWGAPDGPGRTWGIGLLSRRPAQFHAFELPKPGWSPWRRGAIWADLGACVAGTLHLEVWPIGARGRAAQVQAVLAALAARGWSDRPAVLAGDFNCRGGEPHAILRRAGFVPALRAGEPTYRLGPLRLALDQIYVRGARVLRAGVERRARGSDHWPVWADLDL